MAFTEIPHVIGLQNSLLRKRADGIQAALKRAGVDLFDPERPEMAGELGSLPAALFGQRALAIRDRRIIVTLGVTDEIELLHMDRPGRTGHPASLAVIARP